MIKERYTVEGSDEIFDNPMDAVTEAAFQSQTAMNGAPCKIYREVKYTGQDEWNKYTLNQVALSPNIEEHGITVGDDGIQADVEDDVVEEVYDMREIVKNGY